MADETSPKFMERLAQKCSQWAGSSWAFLLAGSIVVLWLMAGPLFHFSDGWHIFIGTICAIITFLMVFLLHRSQIKDSLTMHLKLNEIIASLKGANNHLINIEELTEEQVVALHKKYQSLATQIHSSDEASTHVVTAKIMMEAQEVTVPESSDKS